jgi:hypothetical protein
MLSGTILAVTNSGIHFMRTIVISFLLLGIIVLAIIGSLYIFEVRNADQALDLLMKTEGALLLLGICSAAVSLLLGGGKED